jgi:hypothetical protein
MKKLLLALPLGLALLAPTVTLAAQDHDHRYYDAEHKDYHEWNSHEDRAYRRYWEERHHRYVRWERANEEQRAAYWHWRHEHPDSVLFQVNVR